MFCIHCGNKLDNGDKFCTKCGKKSVKVNEQILEPEKRRLPWKTFVLTLFITSFFWFFYYYGFADKSTESANIMVHLIETVGRQKQAWEKSEQIIELMTAGFSEECIYTEGCIDEVVSRVTTLRAEIDKESAEIDNLWSEDVIGQDLEEYFSILDESSKTKFLDVLNIYFPEETEELETNSQLL